MRISKKAFAAWLRAHPRKRFVAADSRRCPLASFLCKPLQSSEGMPPWAVAFMSAADKLDVPGIGKYGDIPISGAKALRILEKL